jgi:PAS domain-containing protein
MDIELLKDMYDAAPELWYILGTFLFFALVTILSLTFWLLKVRQKNYFLQRDRERYAETLYASHDGYFAFIYPDEKVNDPRKTITERCSRRLAVILGLERGVKSDFNDVLKNFYKDDIRKINKYVGMLKEEGVAFEDYFALKTSNKYFRLEGIRINGSDGNIYCDMIWFRDVSLTTNRIKFLEKALTSAEQKFMLQYDVLDNLPFAVWLRNSNLDIVYCNKKFVDLLPGSTRDGIIDKHLELLSPSGESLSKNLAIQAHNSHRLAKTTTSMIVKGNRLAVEAFEIPFYAEGQLDCTYSAGCLVDINELDELRRNFKRHQDAQLKILGMLGTAFAVFGTDMSLKFFNQAFAELWNLDAAWLETSPFYSAFLDAIREKRLLPEVPDYKAFKNEEQKKFAQLLEPISDLLHLPNGKTLRRMRAPYPMGGVVFAFEDISDRLAATTAYNALIAVQNEILTNLFDAVLIFGTNSRLTFFNQAYLDLWHGDKTFLSTEPTLNEILDSHRSFFPQDEPWESLRDAIKANLLNMTSKTLTLQRTNDQLELNVANLSDGSFMITYHPLQGKPN